MGWVAQLTGHVFDLEGLAEQFQGDRATVSRDGGRYWLESTLFDGLTDSGAVQAAARPLSEEMNGASRIVDSSFRPVQLEDRYVDDDGHAVLLVSAHAEARSRVSATLTVRNAASNEAALPRQETANPGTTYMELAAQDDNVREVLRLLAEDRPDWFRLYKVYEVLESDAGGLGAFATKRECSSFSASANHPGVSGESARHARLTGSTPRRTTTLEEGRAFIHRIGADWPNSKVASP